MDTEKVLKWMDLFHEKILSNKELLTELDTPIGDADHGNNMVRGMNAVQEALEADKPETAVDAFKIIAKNLMSKVGGSAGPLYGSAFLAMAKEYKESEDLAKAVEQAAESIQNRGKSTTGEKTMNDVWVPVSQALAADNLDENLIDEAVQATKDMKATKGRASYVGERSIGHIDPGAYSTGLLFKALLEVMED